jgi:predicted negative regulator of RcsB-dependent stress response
MIAALAPPTPPTPLAVQEALLTFLTTTGWGLAVAGTLAGGVWLGWAMWRLSRVKPSRF